MDIEIICRQTNYTEEEARQKLDTFTTVEGVIRDYLQPRKRDAPKVNDSQIIYNEINSYMNTIFKQRT